MDNHHDDKIFCVRYKLQNKFEVSYICEAEANWPIIAALLEDEKYDDEQCCWKMMDLEPLCIMTEGSKQTTAT